VKGLLISIIIIIVIMIISVSFLYSTIINVPHNYPTIKGAIKVSQHGDIIEVDDGFYFERNIIINKKIILRSKNLYGAVLDGSGDQRSAIFIVKAEAEIQGFILKNAGIGILQRFSPDVKWIAHDLAILNMQRAAISINDAFKNIGRGYLYNVIIDNCSSAFSTNDAFGLEIEESLITNCSTAFSGSNHFYFNVRKTKIWNCKKIIIKSSTPQLPPRTNEINLSPDVFILDSLVYDNQIDPLMISKINNQNNSKRNSAVEGLTFNIVGDIYFKLKNYSKAEGFYKIALIIGKKTNSKEIILHSYYGLALIYKNMGKFLEALDFCNRAIEIIEKIRKKLPLAEYKSGFLKDKLQIYELAINLLFKLYKKNSKKNYIKKAFYLVERTKARAFLDSLQEAEIVIKKNLNYKYQKLRDKISQEISLIINKLQRELPSEQRKRLLKELRQKEEKYKSLIIKIKRKNLLFRDLLPSKPFKLEQIQKKLLGNNTALLEYLIGENYSFALLLTKKNVYMARLIEPFSLIEMINNYINFLIVKETKEFKGIKGGRKLYKLLIEPFENYLNKIQKIIIIPDKNLYYLPFETFIPSKFKNQNSKFLIEEYEISYAYSASSLTRLLERKFDKKREKELLAMGSPLLSKNTQLITGDLSLYYKQYYIKKFKFFPLSFAYKEIKSISRFFKKDLQKLFLKENATETNIKKLKLNDFKIIHIATHGLLDNENWWRSALVFSKEKEFGEDGLLQVREIYNLRLNADLVVLSACQTAKGKLEKGEGIIGMSRAFLCAGAKSVISSLWNVNDKSTVKFMKYFYQYLAQGKTKTQALRQTKLKMLNSRYKHPYYWAPFILIGDYNSSIKISKPSFLEKLFHF